MNKVVEHKINVEWIYNVWDLVHDDSQNKHFKLGVIETMYQLSFINDSQYRYYRKCVVSGLEIDNDFIEKLANDN